MKRIFQLLTLVLPFAGALFLGQIAHAGAALPPPEIRLIRFSLAPNGGGMRLDLQVKPQKGTHLADEVEVASPLTLTDDKGAPLARPEVVSPWSRPVDKVLVLKTNAIPPCDWFRVGGVLRVTQGGDVKRGSLHTCPTCHESRFEEGGITFTVNEEKHRALAERVWNERIPKPEKPFHPKSVVWVACNAADACRVQGWELAGGKGADPGFVHRASTRTEGSHLWLMGYDTLQREVQIRPSLYGTVQTAEFPVDCVCGIAGQTPEPSPLPEVSAPAGGHLRLEYLSWDDDDHPGMVGMCAGQPEKLRIALGAYDAQGGKIAPVPPPATGCKLRVTDAQGRQHPCRVQVAGNMISLSFPDSTPSGSWMKVLHTDPQQPNIPIDGIYTLRGRLNENTTRP